MFKTVKQAAEKWGLSDRRVRILCRGENPRCVPGGTVLEDSHGCRKASGWTEEFTVEYTYNSNAIEGNTLTLRETDMVLRGADHRTVSH